MRLRESDTKERIARYGGRSIPIRPRTTDLTHCSLRGRVGDPSLDTYRPLGRRGRGLVAEIIGEACRLFVDLMCVAAIVLAVLLAVRLIAGA